MSDVLAVSEHRQGELRDVSYEMITAGRELADQAGGDLHLAVISGDVDAYALEERISTITVMPAIQLLAVILCPVITGQSLAQGMKNLPELAGLLL